VIAEFARLAFEKEVSALLGAWHTGIEEIGPNLAEEIHQA
jgi:hypothetical protein